MGILTFGRAKVETDPCPAATQDRKGKRSKATKTEKACEEREQAVCLRSKLLLTGCRIRNGDRV